MYTREKIESDWEWQELSEAAYWAFYSEGREQTAAFKPHHGGQDSHVLSLVVLESVSRSLWLQSMDLSPDWNVQPEPNHFILHENNALKVSSILWKNNKTKHTQKPYQLILRVSGQDLKVLWSCTITHNICRNAQWKWNEKLKNTTLCRNSLCLLKSFLLFHFGWNTTVPG